MFFFKLLDLFKCVIQHLLSIRTLLLSLISQVFGTIGLNGCFFLFFCNNCLLLFGIFLVSGETDKEFRYLLIFLFKLRLHFSELNFHFLNLLIGWLKFLKTCSESVCLETDFFPFCWENLFVHGEKFQIRSWSDVIMSIEFMQKGFTIALNWLVYGFEHLNQFGDSAFDSKLLLIINKLSSTNINQCLFRPLSEPINCGAVDQWREHSQSGGELIAQWGHDDNHVNVPLDSNEILSENICLCRRNTLLRTVSLACLRHILHVLLLINACYISTV